MDYGLTDQQNEIVKLAYQVAREKIRPVRERYDQSEEFPWPVVEELRQADLFGVYLPEKYGGMGGGTLDLCLVVEQLSRACAGIALCVAGSGLGTMPILLFGNEAQRQKWLPGLASGKLIGAFAITEAEAGSDATAMKTTAKLEGDHYVLNGSKCFISGGEVAQTYVVFATTNPARGARGIAAFVVEKGTPGFTFGKKEHKMGIRANPTYELLFRDCRVPKENLLYKEGYGLFVAQSTFDMSRPGVASQALGIAQGALDETLAYVRVRKQFGQTVASLQAISHMLADCATSIEASRALLYATGKAMDAAVKPAIDAAMAGGTIVFDEINRIKIRRYTKESAMCKVLCSDTAMKVAVDCVQMCGGVGYMRDFHVEKFMRDAKITQIYEGTNQIQRNEIAAMLIKETASSQRA
ncbi:MAG TPA: acyl-CoA dehydrogenase [Elusimicrobia bacterium]|nr:acyl-CoA dehydrogenase [Elusimicrobiota bacterium]HBT61744.1 acyl-CoA dehydrogenase [Elusimicrobiota bacterium]